MSLGPPFITIFLEKKQKMTELSLVNHIICRCLAEYLPALEESLNLLVSQADVVLHFPCHFHINSMHMS